MEAVVQGVQLQTRFFAKWQDTDDSVSRLSRPRFGKRETLANTFPKKSDVEAFMRLQGVDDSLSRLSRPRYCRCFPFMKYRKSS